MKSFQINSADKVIWLIFTLLLPTVSSKADERVDAASVRQTGTSVNLLDSQGQLVLSYNTETVKPPAGVNILYERSGFIHPIKTPSGLTVTDAFPADHLHQHALFSAWVNTEFQGKPVDFWNQMKAQGTVSHREVLELDEKQGAFTVRLAHVAMAENSEKVDVLHEEWSIRNVPHASLRLFDVATTQTCVADDPLLVKEYHYGGMALRGSAQWMGEQHQFMTSEGKSRSEANHSRPKWVAMYGEVDGKPCGIVVFSHPDNFRGLQPVRIHPKMPYFVFTPPVLGDFEIRPHNSIRSKFRYHPFDGEPNPQQFNELWKEFAASKE